MGQIEEIIRLLGVEEVRRGLESVERAQDDVGKSAEEAGHKSAGAGQQLGTMDRAMQAVTASAMKMVAGMLTIEAATQALRAYLDMLRQVDEAQKSLAEKTVGFAADAKIFGQQIGVSEAEGMRILSELQVAGGIDRGTASQLGIMAHIALGSQGGLLAGQNLETAKMIAGFAGAKGFTATEGGSLFSLLNTAGALTSPQAALEATAKIAAAADASKAASIGAFVGMVERGGTAMFQAGMDIDDVLAIAGQARQVTPAVGGEELAAQAMLTLTQVATGAEKGFEAEILRTARAQGLDPATMTTADRIGIATQILGGITDQASENRVRAMLSPERAQRLIPSFRASNIAATTQVAAAGAGATAADAQRTIDQSRRTVTYQAAAGQAAREYAAAAEGAKYMSYALMSQMGAAAVERYQARGGWVSGWWGYGSEEALREASMRGAARQMVEDLQASGVAEEELSTLRLMLGNLGDWGYSHHYGWDDTSMRHMAGEVGRLQQKYPTAINYFNTAYFDRLPGDPDPPVSMDR